MHVPNSERSRTDLKHGVISRVELNRISGDESELIEKARLERVKRNVLEYVKTHARGTGARPELSRDVVPVMEWN
jgi:hypothetical protein